MNKSKDRAEEKKDYRRFVCNNPKCEYGTKDRKSRDGSAARVSARFTEKMINDQTLEKHVVSVIDPMRVT
ncbi:MAG: hypothetical protein EU530_02580 [Promethearchaeota archaeon]|nr:MAG: hypothetical protein EU530_02580 [Candidatus Lokiarchaeota archaeon]